MTDWLSNLAEIQVTKPDKKNTQNVGSPYRQNRQYPGEEIAARLERIAEEKNHPIDDLLDWYKNDMEDLAQKSTADLRFIVSDFIDNLKFYGREIPDEEPEVISHPSIRCGDCKHFKPIDHPFLGHCLLGIPESPAGMWSTSQRWCDKYIEVTAGSMK